MDTVDPVIKEGASEQELETMKALGFLARSCFNDQRRNRPSMKEVADKIKYMIGFLTNFESCSCIRVPANKAVVTSQNPNSERYGSSNCINFSIIQLSSRSMPRPIDTCFLAYQNE